MRYDERFWDSLRELLIPIDENSVAFREYVSKKGLEKETIDIEAFNYFSPHTLQIFTNKREEYYTFIDRTVSEKARLLFPSIVDEDYFNNLFFVLKCGYNQYFLTELNVARAKNIIAFKKDIQKIITNFYEDEIVKFKIGGIKTSLGLSHPLTIKFLIDSIAFSYAENLEILTELDEYDDESDSHSVKSTLKTTMYDLLMLIDRDGNLGITDFINARMENSHSDKQLELVFKLLDILGLINSEKIESSAKDYIRSHLTRNYSKETEPIKKKMAVFFASSESKVEIGKITIERTIK